MEIVNSVMDCSIKTSISIIFVNTLLVCRCTGRYVGYNPSHSETETVENSRVNLEFEPKECPDGMIGRYHHSNGAVSWICECQSGKLFFHQTQSCYDAYTRGPCQEEEHLIILEGEEIPRCEANPCGKDFTISLNGGCNQLSDSILHSFTAPSASGSVVKSDQRSSEKHHRLARGIVIGAPILDLCAPGFRKVKDGTCTKEIL